MSIEWVEFDELVLETQLEAGNILREVSEEWVGIRKEIMDGNIHSQAGGQLVPDSGERIRGSEDGGSSPSGQ